MRLRSRALPDIKLEEDGSPSRTDDASPRSVLRPRQARSTTPAATTKETLETGKRPARRRMVKRELDEGPGLGKRTPGSWEAGRSGAGWSPVKGGSKVPRESFLPSVRRLDLGASLKSTLLLAVVCSHPCCRHLNPLPAAGLLPAVRLEIPTIRPLALFALCPPSHSARAKPSFSCRPPQPRYQGVQLREGHQSSDHSEPSRRAERGRRRGRRRRSGESQAGETCEEVRRLCRGVPDGLCGSGKGGVSSLLSRAYPNVSRLFFALPFPHARPDPLVLLLSFLISRTQD